MLNDPLIRIQRSLCCSNIFLGSVLHPYLTPSFLLSCCPAETIRFRTKDNLGKICDTRRWLCAGGKHTATCDRVAIFLPFSSFWSLFITIISFQYLFNIGPCLIILESYYCFTASSISISCMFNLIAFLHPLYPL